jgi:signal transduction histidine kinase/Flp pilus assembly protein TadD
MRAPKLFAFFALFVLGLSVAPTAVLAAASPVFEKAIEDAKSAMMSDPQEALKKVDVALSLSQKQSGPQGDIAHATALWLKIEANIALNRLDVAQQHLEGAVKLAQSAAPNSKLHGDLIRSKGAVAGLNGKASEALRHYLEAHRIFEVAKEKRSQAIALQDIGLIYWEAGDYQRMLTYLDEAQDIYNDDPGFELGNNNNRGEAYRILGRYEEAEKAFTAAFANARAMDSPMLQTRILTNLALVQVEMGKLKAAEGNAILAERLGANAEARDWLPFVQGAKATIAAKRGNDRQAVGFLEQLFAGVDLSRTDLTYKEFHKLASDLYVRLGEEGLALRHLQAFQRLESETRELVTSTSSQLLAARFDSANQKTRIAELKQGQLQRDIEIERQKGTITTGLLIASLVLILVGGVAFFSIRRSRNQVRDANEVLTTVNTKLESALRAKTDFLAMTSHEIRTPLNGIMGMTQVILADARLDKETRERVGLILGAGQTMQTLVNDLLDTAKMENGEITVSKELFDLRGLLIESMNFWRAEASSKGLEIELDAASLPARAFTDSGRIRQVIFNLLANAIKFTPHGVIRLTARQLDSGAADIRVEDSGIGIPVDQLELIFEPFHQVNNGMSRDFGGAGLGLSICRNIMTALGGTISATSSVDQGSCFIIHLPIGNEIKQPNLGVGGGELDEGCRPVIVDANELRLAKLRAVLHPHADSIFGAKSIEEAKGWLEARTANLLIFDTSTVAAAPNELDEIGALISFAKARKIPSIILFAAGNIVSLDQISDLDPDLILEKPLKVSLLIEKMHQITKPIGYQSLAA